VNHTLYLMAGEGSVAMVARYCFDRLPEGWTLVASTSRPGRYE
jgi:hypothetical protein